MFLYKKITDFNEKWSEELRENYFKNTDNEKKKKRLNFPMGLIENQLTKSQKIKEWTPGMLWKVWSKRKVVQFKCQREIIR